MIRTYLLAGVAVLILLAAMWFNASPLPTIRVAPPVTHLEESNDHVLPASVVVHDFSLLPASVVVHDFSVYPRVGIGMLNQSAEAMFDG